MLPQHLQIDRVDLTPPEIPSYTYRLDVDSKTIIDHIDGLPAIEQSVFKILSTERYQYLIYSFNYGTEISDLVGKPKDYAYAELKRRIKEALTQDDRILDVNDFGFSSNDKKSILVNFKVESVWGDLYMEQVVINNGQAI